eukprot:5794321-Alexandrium_andersonii.AAC.1
MHWMGSAVCRKPGCNGKVPGAPDCIKPRAAKKAPYTPPRCVQSMLDDHVASQPKPEPAPDAMQD